MRISRRTVAALATLARASAAVTVGAVPAQALPTPTVAFSVATIAPGETFFWTLTTTIPVLGCAYIDGALDTIGSSVEFSSDTTPDPALYETLVSAYPGVTAFSIALMALPGSCPPLFATALETAYSSSTLTIASAALPAHVDPPVEPTLAVTGGDQGALGGSAALILGAGALAFIVRRRLVLTTDKFSGTSR